MVLPHGSGFTTFLLIFTDLTAPLLWFLVPSSSGSSWFQFFFATRCCMLLYLCLCHPASASASASLFLSSLVLSGSPGSSSTCLPKVHLTFSAPLPRVHLGSAHLGLHLSCRCTRLLPHMHGTAASSARDNHLPAACLRRTAACTTFTFSPFLPLR